MNRSFQLVQGGVAQNQQLVFWARSVSIDNPGGQYVFVPQANLTVPPYTGGVVAQLPAAANTVRFDTTAPAGQHANGGGSPATLTFDSELLPVASGTQYTALQLANAHSTCYTLANGATVGPATLTFWAQTVTINNPGDQWIRLPDVNVDVAPWTGGVVVALPVQTQTVNINTTPPTGQVANGGGSSATVCFTDAPLSASPGYSYQQLTPAGHATLFSPAAGSHTVATLTFSASAIRVDNPGGQWLQIVIPGGLSLIVPPFTVGRIVALHTVTTAVDITATAISGQTNTGAGAGAQVLYTDQQLPESAGVSFGQNLTPGGQTLVISANAIGPNPSSATFSFSDTTQLVNGQVYDVLAVSPVLVYNGTQTAVSAPFVWSLGYGGVSFLQDQGATGSNVSPGVAPPSMFRLLPAGVRITGATGSHFTFTATQFSGAAFGLNQVLGACAIYVRPAAL